VTGRISSADFMLQTEVSPFAGLLALAALDLPPT
jgi:hypothetical protein